MSNIEADQVEEKPLDPAMESVRRKMVRLQLVSGGVMLIMFMAVLAAIVYKITARDSKPEEQIASGFTVPSDAPLKGTMTLPDGFSVSAVSHAGSQIMFYGSLPDGTRKALIYDISAGRTIADIDVTGK
ncbi:hypothetical protein [Sinorhizobium sp. BG8]|uniref:hypothetical protein n=1 Tax=Sinorhizobium sp. BG8 TaxID=2613773 RepID=UPI00193CABA6|nr:hypothetical protein [Sinorhizobium sp. BG8]QRM56570.1 hypothetical protein F3Y30_20065 [Sinorhizobium sp. BG8]